jgi:membrane protease YdiL (CAAX protease family)
MINLNATIFVIYGMLSAAMLSVWLPESSNKIVRVPIWVILLSASCGLAFYNNILEIGGIIYFLGLAISCTLFKHQNRWISISGGFLVISLTIGLFLHKVPYFNNPLVFNEYYLSAQSSAYSKNWNFDKAVAGLILLVYFGDISRTTFEWAEMIKKTYLITIITIISTLALAILFGYIELDITFVFVFFTWAWANLLFTCVAEEMLFRGFIQKHLLLLTHNPSCQLLIVVFVGVLFGLAHYSGGMTYAILASVAGIGYGYAYYRSGKIESAILTHFMLNSTHFLFFTYQFKRVIT